MKKFKKIIIIVLDSVGIGQLPDCQQFGDSGVNTLGNISNTVGLNVPNLQKLGLGNIGYLKTVLPATKPLAKVSKMAEVSQGKDTLTGHWEMMGNSLHQGFNQYIENGFPPAVIEEFEQRTGRKVLGNKEANGMKVIGEYIEEHLATGNLIVYTSADSTFQIAAHEEVVPLEELYQACEIASSIVQTEEYNVARIIARPFLGTAADFYRTSNRHDYAQAPTKKIVMEKLQEANKDVIAIGKINDIFTGKGVTESYKTKSNMDGVDITIEQMKRGDVEGLIFTNLVDFDTLGGHPRATQLYADLLSEFDQRLPEIIENVGDDDLLILTADHGNDPTYKGNDHTREYVPLICYSKNINGGNFPIRKSFEDLGQTICENWNLEDTIEGTSFLEELGV